MSHVTIQQIELEQTGSPPPPPSSKSSRLDFYDNILNSQSIIKLPVPFILHLEIYATGWVTMNETQVFANLSGFEVSSDFKHLVKLSEVGTILGK